MEQSLRVIARQLGRASSTISREVRRNGGVAGYRATASDQAAWNRALRPKICTLVCHPALAHAVSVKLRRKGSPEQVAGWLNRTFPREAHKQVSHALTRSHTHFVCVATQCPERGASIEAFLFKRAVC
jgi:IS30 family transposase